MKRFLFVLLLGAVLILVLSDDVRRMAGQPFDRFRKHFYTMRGGQPTQVPMAASEMANARDITVEKAYEAVTNALANAPRFRFEGHVVEQLPSGHIMVVGNVRDASTVLTPRATAYALFGYPSSATAAPNAEIRCDVKTTGVHQFARAAGNIVRMEEIIYAGEFTPWTNERGRTLLDRP